MDVPAPVDPGYVNYILSLLGRYPLCSSFETCGNFIMPTRCCTFHYDEEKARHVPTDAGPLYKDAPDAVRFWGNFATLSCVFQIDTTDVDTINRLTSAIRSNQATAAYAQCKQDMIEADQRRQDSYTVAGIPK